MNPTDIELEDGTVIPDSNATATAPPAPAERPQTPRLLRQALWTSTLLLVGGTAYHLGDAANPAPPWLPQLAPWAVPAIQAGAIGLAVTALAWLVWRLAR